MTHRIMAHSASIVGSKTRAIWGVAAVLLLLDVCYSRKFQQLDAPLLPAADYDHVGIVTNDTHRLSSNWAHLLGIDTPSTFNNAGPPANLTYHGVHTDANILGAYFGCAKLEILQPTDTYPRLTLALTLTHPAWCRFRQTVRSTINSNPNPLTPSMWRDHYRQFGSSPFYLGFATDQWQERDLEDFTQEFTRIGCPTQQVHLGLGLG